jgi:hypothetical protein
VGLHQVTRIQPYRQHQPLPLDPVPTPANTAGSGLAFDGVELVLPLEPDPAGFAQQQPIGGVVGPTGELLDGECTLK